MHNIMQVGQFYKQRQSDWKKLENLLTHSQHGVNKLSPEAIESLGNLYRAASADLALAQRDFGNQRVTLYLNQLVARAHAVVYHHESLPFQRILRFVTTSYPRIYREHWSFILVAMALFIIPALLSAVSTRIAPDTSRWLLPKEMQAQVAQLEDQELWTDIPVNERPYASSFIMRNNIQVTFLAFGGGMLAGLTTVWVMVFNGLILGGLSGLAGQFQGVSHHIRNRMIKGRFHVVVPQDDGPAFGLDPVDFVDQLCLEPNLYIRHNAVQLGFHGLKGLFHRGRYHCHEKLLGLNLQL